MIIKISKDIKIQEYWANGKELASIMGRDRYKGKRILSYPEFKKQFVHKFSNPILMTDNYRIGKLKPSLRDTLFSLNSSWPKIFEYNGVSVRNDGTYTGVWSPSVDTVFFAKAIDLLFAKNKNYKKGIEIGCGSGYLSKYALEKNKKLESFLVTDINPEAIRSAMNNIKDPRAIFFAGDALNKLKDQKYDLLICNPPYVPRPKSIDDNPYEGVGLLYELLHNAEKYLNPGGVILINMSSLSVSSVLDKNPKLKMKLLLKKTVPLKVNNILNSPSWVKYLLKMGMKKEKKRGYEYWQDLYFYMLKNK